MKKEYLIEAYLKDEKTGEVLVRVSGFDMASFEEDLRKIENEIKRRENLCSAKDCDMESSEKDDSGAGWCEGHADKLKRQ